MSKPVKSAAELERLIHQRLYRLEEVQEDMRANPRLDPRVSAPTWHERDASGRNWNAVRMNSAATVYRFWVGEVVEYLRWKYDMPDARQAASDQDERPAVLPGVAGSEPGRQGLFKDRPTEDPGITVTCAIVQSSWPEVVASDIGLPGTKATTWPEGVATMGEHAQITADRYGLGRREQDELALASHQNLARAYDEGFFEDLVMPDHGLKRDNNLRPGGTLERMGKLPGAFAKGGSISAANATPSTDGASAVLLCSEEFARARGLPILAFMTSAEVSAIDFREERERLLMAPAHAIPRMQAKRGLALRDFDFYEIHEAFAAVVLCTLASWESEAFCRDRLGLDRPLGPIDRARLNVKGSSIAAGHPFAATGRCIVGTLAKILSQAGSGRGLISICAAGGQGVTAILER